MLDKQPDSQIPEGLSETEAQSRLQRDGRNELPSGSRRHLSTMILEVLKEPMFLLLSTACMVYFLLGNAGDAAMLAGFVIIVIGITVFQTYRTERTLAALRQLTSPRALVMRDGVKKRISGAEIVKGDLLMLAEGDRIPADALLVESSNITVDESQLSGESAPVRKYAINSEDVMSKVESSHLYCGSLVVQGHGLACVSATGQHTEIGKIGKSLEAEINDASPLQLEIGRLVRILSVIGLLLCIFLILMHGFQKGEWLQGLLSGITLAMTLLPEEYPVVMTIFLAMGAWRISKVSILTRRMPAVVSLGSATVLCVDKTGTLTQNKMQTSHLWVDGSILEVTHELQHIPDHFHELLEYAVLSSEINSYDPMESSIFDLANRYLSESEHIHHDWEVMHDYAISPQLLALSRVWKARDRDEYIVACKGAPEAIADLCHLNEAAILYLNHAIDQFANRGLRVIAVAHAIYTGPEWPAIQHDFEFRLSGLIGLIDPVRPSVPAAVQECASAGIRVVMITGDYPATALAISREAGISVTSDTILTGPEIETMDDVLLRERARSCNLYARMSPQQKFRLVNVLKDNGEIVVMTGDGVNDGPALRAAHIGIAMGVRGTDVAREAADLVLLNDDFASIVDGIRQGRTIYDNMQKAMTYIFAAHIPIIGISFVPMLSGMPAIFAPIHIVFLEMIINPACSIAFEAEKSEQNIMQRPPRDPAESLFGRRPLITSLIQGSLLLLMSLAILNYSMSIDSNLDTARTMTFLTIVLGNLGLILANRSMSSRRNSTSSRNPAMKWIILVALLFVIMAITLPGLIATFHFYPITPWQFMICLASASASTLWFALYKLTKQQKIRRKY